MSLHDDVIEPMLLRPEYLEHASTSKQEDLDSTNSDDSGHVSNNSLEQSASPKRSLLSLPSLEWNTSNENEAQPLIQSAPRLQYSSREDCRSMDDMHWDQPLKGNLATAASKNSLHSSCTTTSSLPCRICHVSSSSSKNPLVSPCRCSGSMLLVHKSCLVHWLELSTRKMVPSPRCELCGYHYRRSNVFHLGRVHFPQLETRDKVLNAVFVIVFITMLVSAAICIHFLQFSDQYTTIRGYRVVHSHLTQEDLTVIVCSILFFTSFFIAIFTQYRAEASIFRMIFRFWVINRNWTIRDYDIRDDPEMLAVRQARQSSLATETQNKSVLPTGNTKICHTLT